MVHQTVNILNPRTVDSKVVSLPSAGLFMAMMVKKQGLSSSVPSSEWPDKAVSVLLKTYAEKFSADRGYLRTQDWHDVSYAVNCVCIGSPKTLKQCRDKVDSLKRRYKIEKRKAIKGGEVSWPFFHRLDDIMNSVLKQGRLPYSRHHNASSAHGSADADGGDGVEEGEEFPNEGEGVEETTGMAVNERCDVLDLAGNGNGAQKNEKQAESYLSDSLSASSADTPPFPVKKRALHQRRSNHRPHVSSEDDIDDYRSYHHLRHHSYGGSNHRRQENFPKSGANTFSGGTQESTENASHGRLKQIRGHKRKLDCDNGINTLACAVTGLMKPHLSAPCFSDMFAQIELTKLKILKKVRSEVSKLDRRQRKSRSMSKSSRSESSSYQ
ncbi:hypothetical protein KP509_12G091400 [Ceratopteris richardii]|uniref:Myb/SANT-like DNA-binding domain-containing protein n=1 Tax=Ceratopteris richardii TaxID=49495 RepID=A0A8T2TUF1_CERRI|nr:hypothetical protein KP509_12G091400 [Ceratopteris richardii]